MGGTINGFTIKKDIVVGGTINGFTIGIIIVVYQVEFILVMQSVIIGCDVDE